MEQTTKYPWQSKTLVLNAVMGLLAVTGIFWPGATSLHVWMTANGAIVGTVWAGLNLVLRLVTKDKISLID